MCSDSHHQKASNAASVFFSMTDYSLGCCANIFWSSSNRWHWARRQSKKHVSRCLYLTILSFRSFFWLVLVFTSGRGSDVHFCPRPRSSTEVFNGPSQRLTDAKNHTPCSPCSHALLPCYHRMCVIAENLGSPDRLGHAARHGSKRAVSFG